MSLNPAIREWLAAFALIGMIPTGVFFTATVVACFPGWGVVILIVLFLFGIVGIYAGGWPLFEYLLVLVIVTIAAGLLMLSTAYGCCIQGAVAGYLWGGYFAAVIDRPNTHRLANAARKQNP